MAKKKLLIASIIAGALAAFLVYFMSKQEKEKWNQFEATKRPVVVAQRDLPAGAMLQAADIKTELFPKSYIAPTMIMQSDVDIYLNGLLGKPVKAGQPLLSTDFSVQQVSNSLATKIPKEERALSVPVDLVNGVSGLLLPGDNVDILATFPVSDNDQIINEGQGGTSVGYAAVTLLQEVTLLAVGSDTSEINAANRRRSYSTITLSVTPKEAELLVIAQTRAKLTMLLRNPKDDTNTTPTTTSLKDLLKNLELLKEVRVKRAAKKPTQKCPPKTTGRWPNCGPIIE